MQDYCIQYLLCFCQEFCVDPVDRYLPNDFVTEHGFYSSNPVSHSIDGAFAARLVRSLWHAMWVKECFIFYWSCSRSIRKELQPVNYNGFWSLHLCCSLSDHRAGESEEIAIKQKVVWEVTRHRHFKLAQTSKQREDLSGFSIWRIGFNLLVMLITAVGKLAEELLDAAAELCLVAE